MEHRDRETSSARAAGGASDFSNYLQYSLLRIKEYKMAYIVTGNCERCRFTDCVVVCPVDCFHGDDVMLYIDPETCIDCDACAPECPVEAIYPEEDVPEDQQKWISINAERAAQLPVITDKQDPYPGAEERKTELGF
jgi:ferredoxin